MRKKPALLLLPGWDDSDQALYRGVTADCERSGWACRTLNFPGTHASKERYESAARPDHLQDLLIAYDDLTAREDVDASAVAIVGVSYGGYIGALVTARRPVRWLGLRAAAIYEDHDWEVPKAKLDDDEQAALRRISLSPQDNLVLAACAQFRGDALVVEGEHDQVVPHTTTANYCKALRTARSLAHHLIPGADHALSQPRWRDEFKKILLDWLAEARAS
ncbi:Transcriptional regulatory protein TcrA (fragment) [Burkholderiales bacterium 8X]